MTDSIVRIEWGFRVGEGGFMEIDCNEFFPTTKIRVNKLLKIIGAYDDYTKDTIDKISSCIRQKQDNIQTHIEDSKAEWNRMYNEFCELKSQAEKGKAPSGVLLTKEQWTRAKNRVQDLKRDMKHLEVDVKNYQAELKRIQKNIECIEGWKSNV